MDVLLLYVCTHTVFRAHLMFAHAFPVAVRRAVVAPRPMAPRLMMARNIFSSKPSGVAFPHSKDPASFGAENPFILIARVQVKPGKVEEYLEIAGRTYEGVQDSEDFWRWSSQLARAVSDIHRVGIIHLAIQARGVRL